MRKMATNHSARTVEYICYNHDCYVTFDRITFGGMQVIIHEKNWCLIISTEANDKFSNSNKVLITNKINPQSFFWIDSPEIITYDSLLAILQRTIKLLAFL